jgi:hypothetical protein
MAITFKVTLKCDFDGLGGCANAVECDASLRTGPQGIPILRIAAPDRWDPERTEYVYGREWVGCLCPEHSQR